jgi:hypothetical protein
VTVWVCDHGMWSRVCSHMRGLGACCLDDIGKQCWVLCFEILWKKMMSCDQLTLPL